MRRVARNILLLVFVCSGGVVGEATASSIASVVAVLDGDTIDVEHNGTKERIRLNGIDAPETGQDYGRRATEFLGDLIGTQTVTIRSHGVDSHGRTIGDVVLPDGKLANHEMVKAGLAWWYCRYSASEALRDLQIEAREAKRGLWRDPVPIPPWVYRKLQRKQVPDVLDFECPGERGSTPLAAPNTAPSAPVMANRKSHLYHLPECPGYGKISPKNQIPFPSVEEAEAAGYKRARNCP